MKVLLTRTLTGDEGTFGLINLPDKNLVLYTGEEPWRDNKSDESCIPEGVYQCAWTLSPRLGKFTYEVQNVPGRTGIRVHSANFMGDPSKGYKKELSGCIALGLKLGKLENQMAVLQSKDAVQKFNAAFNGQPFDLEIVYL